ncbi:MAG: hypothetical protein JSV83_24510 [Desulfobacterales bacterium]|nr:MAG: hypothetical protein JSV83_24510 [Desulfobacterales bacterium]
MLIHTEKSILDFKQLEFSENRTTNLKQLVVADMLAKYEEFYLPELLDFQESEGIKAD